MAIDVPVAPLLIFDGDCGFCSSAVRWVAAGWRPESGATAVPWQDLGPVELEAIGLTTEQVGAAAWWVDRRGRAHRGHTAMALALQESSGWRARAGRRLGVPPLSWLAAVAYPLVVRWRHRLPGGTPACQLKQ